MNKKNSFLVLIAIFVLISLSALLYSSMKQRMQEQSEAAFKEALEKEFIQRGTEVNLKYSVNKKNALPNNKKNRTVSMTDELGTQKYMIDPEKDAMNVATDPDIQMFHTIVFRERPIHPDTLNNNWQRTLQSKGIYAKTGLNIVVMDRNQNNHQKRSRDGFMCVPHFHLSTFYIGYICEIEVSCFIHYSISDILISNWLSFMFLFLGIMISTFFILFLLKKREKRKKEDKLVESSTPFPTIEDSHAQIYTISPDTVFNSITQQIIFKDEIRTKLPGQLSALLILFIEAEKCEITDETIINKLWSDKSGNTTRLYAAMKRLRNELKQDPSISIIHIHPNKYKLTIS